MSQKKGGQFPNTFVWLWVNHLEFPKRFIYPLTCHNHGSGKLPYKWKDIKKKLEGAIFQLPWLWEVSGSLYGKSYSCHCHGSNSLVSIFSLDGSARKLEVRDYRCILVWHKCLLISRKWGRKHKIVLSEVDIVWYDWLDLSLAWLNW